MTNEENKQDTRTGGQSEELDSNVLLDLFSGFLIGFTLSAAINRIGMDTFVFPAAICALSTVSLVLRKLFHI